MQRRLAAHAVGVVGGWFELAVFQAQISRRRPAQHARPARHQQCHRQGGHNDDKKFQEGHHGVSLGYAEAAF